MESAEAAKPTNITSQELLAADQAAKELLPYQQRVVLEKSELDTKIKALAAFLDSPDSKHVPSKELSLMITQGTLMHMLSMALRDRINYFNAPPPVVGEEEAKAETATESAPGTPGTEEIIEILDVDTMARATIAWHARIMSDLENLMQIPEGAVFELTQGDNAEVTSVILSGDNINGFKAGVVTALSIVDNLPFKEVSNAD